MRSTGSGIRWLIGLSEETAKACDELYRRIGFTISSITVFQFTYNHNVQIYGLKRYISLSTVQKHLAK